MWVPKFLFYVDNDLRNFLIPVEHPKIRIGVKNILDLFVTTPSDYLLDVLGAKVSEFGAQSTLAPETETTGKWASSIGFHNRLKFDFGVFQEEMIVFAGGIG